MDEKTKIEENKAEDTANDTGEGTQQKADGMLKDLYTENNRSEQLIKDRRKLLEEEKEFYARQKIGGITRAGQTIENVSPEDKKKKQATDFFKGTALGDAIKKTNE